MLVSLRAFLECVREVEAAITVEPFNRALYAWVTVLIMEGVLHAGYSPDADNSWAWAVRNELQVRFRCGSTMLACKAHCAHLAGVKILPERRTTTLDANTVCN